jgi:tRNA (guanine37-N1)-methyltransferase
MKVEPLAGCLDAVKAERPRAKVILTSPRGRTFTQQMARNLAREPGLIIICGRYEGVDERVSALYVDNEVSLGDFVLTGGELAAMIMVDAVSRFVPGVLGGAGAAHTDSFSDGLLEYPQYTRPPEYRGLTVPEVLLSGNHAGIALWRRRQSLMKTRRVRPELLAAADVTDKEWQWLTETEGKDSVE